MRILCNAGLVFLHQESYESAVFALILMSHIFRHILKSDGGMIRRYSNDLQKTIGKEAFFALKTQLESEAEQILEQALREGVSSNGG
jgi:hypothetical protein